jgi:hypothetical protein
MSELLLHSSSDHHSDIDHFGDMHLSSGSDTPLCSDAFVLDLSAGIGYSSGNSRRSIYSSGESGLASTIGFNIGWMIR